MKLFFGCDSRKMEQRNLEQLNAIKFCLKLEELASVTFEMLKHAYGEHSLSRAQVLRWHKSFLKGREHIEDEHIQGGLQLQKLMKILNVYFKRGCVMCNIIINIQNS